MARYFTPDKDHYGRHPDGRVYVIAHAHVPIAVAQAERLGVIPAEGAAPEQLSDIEESSLPRRSVRGLPPVASAESTDAASGAANGQQGANARPRGAAGGRGKGKDKQEQQSGGEGQPTAS